MHALLITPPLPLSLLISRLAERAPGVDESVSFTVYRSNEMLINTTVSVFMLHEKD